MFTRRTITFALTFLVGLTLNASAVCDMDMDTVFFDDFLTLDLDGWIYDPGNCPEFEVASDGDLLYVVSYGLCTLSQYEGIIHGLPQSITPHQDFEISFKPVALTDLSGEMGGVMVFCLNDADEVVAAMAWFEPQVGTGYGGVTFYAEGDPSEANLIYGDLSGWDTEYPTINDTMRICRIGDYWSAWVNDVQKDSDFVLAPTMTITKIKIAFYNFVGYPEREIEVDFLSLMAERLDSLIIDSISVFPCDNEYECVAQPIEIKTSDTIAGATIPIEIPDGVEVCGWSREGLVTEDWDFVFDTVAEDYALINLANLQGDVIEPGTTTVAYLLFHAQPECQTSYYIHWDTTLSGDPSKQLKFSDASGQAINPGFNPDRDSTEILGYTPGDFGDDGSVDIADLVGMVDYMFRGGPPPCVMDAVDVNGDCYGPDICDLVYLINWIFLGGPPPVCGCISTGPVAKAVPNPEIIVSSVFKDGYTTVSLNAPQDLRGLQLELEGNGTGEPKKLVGDDLDMVFGQENGRIRIGILDLDGGNTIASGTTRVIQLEGKYEILSALVADEQGRSITPSLNSAAKDADRPNTFSLNQNYPNPFNPTTEISFSLPHATDVKLEVYNITGQKIATLVDKHLDAGEHTCTWDGRESASGVYFYRLTTSDFVDTRKMMLLK